MALPSTPMLDDFSRPDENPLSGNGAWLTGDTAFTGDVQVTSRATRGADANPGMRYLPNGPNVGDVEVWATMSSMNGGSSARLFARLQSPGGASAIDGYAMEISTGGWQLRQMTNAAFTTLGTGAVAVAAGDIMVFRVVANVLTGYRIRAGVITQAGRGTATIYYATGFLGLGFTTNAATDAQNFGGGAIDSLVPAAHPIGGYGATA